MLLHLTFHVSSFKRLGGGLISQVLFDIGSIGGGGLITAIHGGNNISVVTVAGVATVSVAGTTQYAVQVGNAMGALSSLALGTSGQVLTSNGAGVNPSFQNISASGAITTVTGNDGTPESPSAGNFSFLTANTTVKFLGSVATETLDFGLITNLALGSSLPALAGGASNTSLGTLALSAVTSGSSNTTVGYNSMSTNTQGFFNTNIGGLGQRLLTTGSFNTSVGYASLDALTNTNSNTAIGAGALGALTVGATNIAVGLDAGSAYTTNESNNIVIGNNGVVADNNTIRIGTQGTQTSAYMAGITGVTVGNPTAVVINSVTGQLGVAAGGGQPIETITGNDGTPESPSAGNFNIVTANSTVKFAGTANTETLNFGISNLVLGSSLPSLAGGVGNVGVGNGVLAGITSGQSNTALGLNALHTVSSGTSNTAIGAGAARFITTGQANVVVGSGLSAALATTASFNVIIGAAAGLALTTGQNNTAVGDAALQFLTTGNSCIAIGQDAAAHYTTNEANNIIVGSCLGTALESRVMRLGNDGTGSASSTTATYISGVDGVNVGSVAKVITMASNQLGTAVITAGTGISVTAGANTITIATSGTSTLTYTGVNHAASPYTVLTTDEYLSADVTAGVITIKLPNAPSTGRTYIIKDKVGLAATSNITVTTVGGAVTIDGSTSFVMNTAYQAIQVIFNGSNYEVF